MCVQDGFRCCVARTCERRERLSGFLLSFVDEKADSDYPPFHSLLLVLIPIHLSESRSGTGGGGGAEILYQH